MIYVVLVKGHVHGVYSSPVDAHLVAKPLNGTVEACRSDGESFPSKVVVDDVLN